MNPWLRLVGVVVAAIVAALLLKLLPAAVVLLLFVGGVSAVNLALRGRAKAEARRDEAALVGLRRESSDPFGLLGYPFALFGRGVEPAIGDVAWGTWRGLDVRCFELTFDPPLPVAGAERSRFTCALAPLPSELPHLVLEPVTFVTRLAFEPPLPTVPTGWAEVDLAFLTRCEDRAFVERLVDDDLAGWLVALGEDRGFEVRGGLAMVYGPATSAQGVVATLEVLQGFLKHVSAGSSGGSGSSAPSTSVGP